MLKSQYFTVFLSLSCLLWTTVAVHSGEVRKKISTTTNECIFELTGAISGGELAALKELLGDPDNYSNGESSSRLVLCLNSPGGSVSEGVELAKFVYENGIGTRLEPKAKCYSMCAIIFMMGNAKGPEVSFVNRRMHFTSELAFHRPYLSLKEATGFTSGDIEVAYDLGIARTFDFHALGNKIEPWGKHTFIRPDLMEVIVETPGTDLFFIDTVEKAGRWNIDIDGVDSFAKATPLTAYFACENQLQWEIGRHENIEDLWMTFSRMHKIPAEKEGLEFGERVLNDYQVRQIQTSNSDNQTEYWVTGHKTGYAAAYCRIKITKHGFATCGFDEYTNVRLGTGSCATPSERDIDASNFQASSGVIAGFPPDMPLVAFSLVPFQESFASATAVRCVVVSREGSIVDDEPCISRVTFSANSKQRRASRQISFLWPSGAKTHLEITYKEQRVGDNSAKVHREILINGTQTNLQKIDEQSCFLNASSGNTFCTGPLVGVGNGLR